MKIVKALWLANPENLAFIDLNDATSIDQYATISNWTLDMSAVGWLRLGTATVEYQPAALKEKLTADAVAALEKKLEETDATYLLARNAFLRAISNLRALPLANKEA